MSKTRFTLRAFAFGSLIFSSLAIAAPATVSSLAKKPRQYTIEQFMATTALGGASFSADEKRILFHSNESGIYNAYTLAVTGGKPDALTKSNTDTTYAVSYFPNDDRILYTRDKGGDENNHLYVRELDGSERDLTPGDKLKASFAGWRPDGSAFFVSSNERDPKVFDIYRYDAKSYDRTLFYKNDQAYAIGAISRDEMWVALNKTNTTLDGDVYLYDVAKAETKHLTPHTGTINFSAATFDPASKRLFLLTNEGSEFASLRTYDLVTAAMKDHEKADWDVVSTYFSRDGRYRVTAVNQDGSVVIRIVEGADEKPVKIHA